MKDLIEAVEACDRLNSYVRAPAEAGDWLWRPKAAIYWLKGKILNAVTSAGLASHRMVSVEVQCRSCGGTGKWVSWDYGQTNENCRKCSATGKHLLYFVETTIDGRLRWHTPVKYGVFVEYPFSLTLAQIEAMKPAQPIQDWKPMQKGKPLQPWEVARDLNTLEAFVPERPGKQWSDEGGPYDIFHYTLFVGDTPRRCFRCGAEPSHGLLCSRDYVGWHAWVCKACDTFGKMMVWSEKEQKYVVPGGSVFDAVPFPAEAVEHPEIQKWLERHRRKE